MSFIKIFDFLSPTPSLKIDKNNRFRTNIGGSLALVSILVMASAAIYFTTMMFERKEQNIMYNNSPRLDMAQNISDLPYMIMLVDNKFYPLDEASRYYYIHSEIWETVRDNSTGTQQLVTSRFLIQHEMCNLDKHFGPYREYFKDVANLDKHYCPVPGKNNITLFGVYGSNGDYSYFTHYISKCRNNTVYNGNLTNCYPEDVIKPKLQNVFVSFKFLEYSIDHNDISNPGKFSLRSEAMPVSSTIFKREWFYVRQILYTTDLGYIFEEKTEQSYYQVSPNKETVDLRTEGAIPGSFAMVTTIMDNKVDYYKRSFMKCQQLLANVGGILKGIMTIAQVFVFFISTQEYYFDLTKSLFILNKEIPHMDFSTSLRTLKELKTIGGISKNSNPEIKSTSNFILNENAGNRIKPIKPKNEDEHSKTVNKLDIGKRPTCMNISFKEVLFGSCCSLFSNNNQKYKKYEALKDFVISKICIKELLVKFNEIDKFKATFLNSSEIKTFEEVPNPFPSFKGANSLWKNEEHINIKNESQKYFKEFIAAE